MWQDGDSSLDSVQQTSISGQRAQRWRLRTSAQEATLNEIANSKSRRPLEHNGTFECIYVQVGRKIAPMRRGPAVVLDTDKTRDTVKFCYFSGAKILYVLDLKTYLIIFARK